MYSREQEPRTARTLITNEVKKGKSTKKKIKKAFKLIEDMNADIQVIKSGLIERKDCEINNKISSIINRNLS